MYMCVYIYRGAMTLTSSARSEFSQVLSLKTKCSKLYEALTFLLANSCKVQMHVHDFWSLKNHMHKLYKIKRAETPDAV